MDDKELLTMDDEVEQEFESQLFSDAEFDSVMDDVPMQESNEDNITEEFDTNEVDDVGDLRIKNSRYVEKISYAELNKLKKEYETLKEQLEEAIKAKNEAKEAGDLSENEAYDRAKETVGRLTPQVNALELRIKNAVIVETTANSFIGKGSRVHMVVTDKAGHMKPMDFTVTIVSAGFGTIESSTGDIMMPESSEVYHHIVDSQSGEFDLTGTDGNTYHYKYELIK